MNEILNALLEWIGSIDPVLRTAVAGVAILLETSILIGLVIPGDTVVIFASLGVNGPVEYFSMVAVVIVGALIGESIGFLLGRLFGPRIRASRLGRKLGEANWEKAEQYLDRRGGWAVFLSRFLPVLHALIPVTVGMSKMSYRKFLTWTIPACVIWTFAYVSVGSAAAASYEQISDRLHYAGYIFVGIIAVFLLVLLLIKKLLNKREEKFMDESLTDAPLEAGESAGTPAVASPAAASSSTASAAPSGAAASGVAAPETEDGARP